MPCPSCCQGWVPLAPRRGSFDLFLEIGCSRGCSAEEITWWHAWRTVTVRSLAREVGDAAAGLDATPFILLGEDRVLAHPLLAAGPWRRPADGGPLPRLEDVGDLTLAAIWAERNPLTSNAPFRNAKGHWNLGPEGYAGFTYRKVDGFGDRPWLFGVHYPAALTRRERWIVLGIGLAGVLLLVLALTIAVRIAGRDMAENKG
jgi:hypothetical protein